MNAFVYPSFIADLLAGRIDLAAERLKVLLVHGYQPDPAHGVRMDIDGEISGTGYMQGGKELEATLAEEGGKTILHAADVVWENATLAATGAILYCCRSKGLSADPLVACYDFGERKSRRDRFCLEWGSDGILILE